MMDGWVSCVCCEYQKDAAALSFRSFTSLTRELCPPFCDFFCYSSSREGRGGGIIAVEFFRIDHSLTDRCLRSVTFINF